MQRAWHVHLHALSITKVDCPTSCHYSGRVLLIGPQKLENGLCKTVRLLFY